MCSEGLDTQAILERFRTARGDTFWEFDQLMAYPPAVEVAGLGLAGHVHGYQGATADTQVLSVQMRELIAIVLLASQSGPRFAANHVRRLYRLGVTNAVIVEAALAATPALGFSCTVYVSGAIHRANDPSNLEGALPPGGAPETLVDFPELHLGRDRSAAAVADLAPATGEVWQYAARIDPLLVDLVRRYYEHVYALTDEGSALLPPAARQLIVIPALCLKGAIELAADHIRRATGLGASAGQILAAISSAFPMTGLATVEFGLRAMLRAGIGA